MKDTYENCPVCGKEFQVGTPGSRTISFSCNNEPEIIFAKAARQPIPEYHSFSYDRNFVGFPGHTTRWSLQFNLSPKKVVRLIRNNISTHTDITDRWGQHIIRIDYPLEPDFPTLEKLRFKIKTYINFS